MSITENELIEQFRKDIQTYPFKTSVLFEVPCATGRIDIHLPEYNIVIEAKSEGDMKKAVGQALFYSESTNNKGYILIPHYEVNTSVLSACERADIGIITTRKRTPVFKVVNDIGGFGSFDPKEYTNIENVDSFMKEPRQTELVGGSNN